jgi:mono/diheme cytochrome c family protein
MIHATLLLLLALTGPSARSGQSPAAPDEGRQIYRAACAACHGPDGRGQPRATVGFDTPLPDFTDCSFSTPEPDADWIAIVHAGGPIRAFDRKMPAFGDALSEPEIQRTIAYIRSLCGSRAWPRGELNLPRPLVTEKAFPENETVLTTTIGTGGSSSVGNVLLYEQRLGARSQFELSLPLDFQQDAAGSWHAGLGDAAVAFKRVLFHSLDAGTIVSGGAEVVLPTGKEHLGLGTGTTVFEPFVAIGQILPGDGFIQFQGGIELPADRDRAGNEAFWRAAVGRTISQGRFGRSWSPMIEVVGSRDLEGDEPALWDIVPQVQVTLSRRQHIMISAGVRVPINDRGARDVQVLTYFLWDWFDGGLLDGWR